MGELHAWVCANEAGVLSRGPPWSTDGSDLAALAALAAAAEEPIVAVGLEAGHAGAGGHFEAFEDLARRRIDATQVALVVLPGAVPQSPSTQVTPVT
jgi:hypothetical protein